MENTVRNILVIRDSEWLRGTKVNNTNNPVMSALYSQEKDQFCCLGLHGRACGLSKNDMAEVGEPADLDPKQFYLRVSVPSTYPWITPVSDDAEYFVQLDDAELAMNINDEWRTTDEEKIAALRPLFAKHGWDIDWRPHE